MKYLKYFLISVVIIIFVIIIIYFIKRNKNSKITDIINPVKKPADPIPANSPVLPAPSNPATPKPVSSGWVKEYFPLSPRMYGDKIRLLQRALGFVSPDDDGKFGDKTWAAATAQGIIVPIYESDYNAIVGNPPASSSVAGSSSSVSSSNAGKEVHSKSDITSVYLNDSATNPTFLKFASKDELIGYLQSETSTDYITSIGTKVAKNSSYLS